MHLFLGPLWLPPQGSQALCWCRDANWANIRHYNKFSFACFLWLISDLVWLSGHIIKSGRIFCVIIFEVHILPIVGLHLNLMSHSRAHCGPVCGFLGLQWDILPVIAFLHGCCSLVQAGCLRTTTPLSEQFPLSIFFTHTEGAHVIGDFFLFSLFFPELYFWFVTHGAFLKLYLKKIPRKY